MAQELEVDYLANIRFPTEKAHGAQIMKMCEAFARAGVGIRLIVSARGSVIAEDPFRYYGIPEPFPLVRAGSLDTVSWGAWGFRLQSFTFALSALGRIREGALIYGRDEMVLWTVGLFRNNDIVWESHTGAWNVFARALAKRAKRIVAISQGLKDFYVARGVAENKIIVAHDGVDLAPFAHAESKAEARARLGLPQDKKIALYIGRLDGWKGAEILLKAAAFLPRDVQVAIIGGEPAQIERLQKRYPRAPFLGYHPYAEVADNEAAADVLVLPNTARDITSSRFTSPLKLFTYMASGKPIVASDVPSLREVISEDTAFFVPADDPEALARGVLRALQDPAEAGRRAQSARREAKRYTWETRAAKILQLLHTDQLS